MDANPRLTGRTAQSPVLCLLGLQADLEVEKAD